jgi:2-hydroxy-3-keto-5-methylthiopentenyl-1-phosphate phosphatase
MNTEVLPVSCFTHDFPHHEIKKATLSPKNDEKFTLSVNKTVQGLQKPTKHTLFLSDSNDIEKRKKLDILFVRHKLRRCGGLWAEREKRTKDFFEVDGHSWIS